jgi:hypothetical protein
MRDGSQFFPSFCNKGKRTQNPCPAARFRHKMQSWHGEGPKMTCCLLSAACRIPFAFSRSLIFGTFRNYGTQRRMPYKAM